MRILAVTNLPWRTDISVGNTLSNLFDGLEGELSIAQVFFRAGTPLNAFVGDCFAIPEKQLAKSILTRKPVGRRLVSGQKPQLTSPNDGLSDAYNKARQLRWDSLLLLQDSIGRFGQWRSSNLYRFVEEVEPEILFGALGRVPVVNELLVDLAEKYSLPLFVYAWDDHYSIDPSRKSPFYRIRVALERASITKCASRANKLYVITPELGEFYRKTFSKECSVLRKGYRFDRCPRYEKTTGEIRMLYAGNIGAERWRVLAALTESLNSSVEATFRLDIYTHSPISEEMSRALNVGNSTLHDGVPAEQLPALFAASDVLVHVEATEPKERERCRYSFSTKIVDYLNAGRCILSLGGPTTATEYLKSNDAGIVVNDLSALPEVLCHIATRRGLLEEYSAKAWECGRRNHNISSIQQMLLSDFEDARRMHR